MGHSDVAEQQVFRPTDRPPDVRLNVAELYAAHRTDSYRGTDTAAPYLTNLAICDTSSKDSLVTKNGRNITFEKDGYPHYRVTDKDRRGLYDITNDYLTTRDGRKPTPQEVKDFAQKIAQANGIKDINNIKVGQDLRIPDKVQQGQRVPDARPDRPPTNEHVRPDRVGEPPSKKFADATGLDIYRRKEDVNVNFDGTYTKHFDGAVRDGRLGLGRTQVTGHETTDRNGKVISTEVNMAPPKDIKIPKPGGGEEEVKAKQMKVTYSADGSYHTEVTKDDGTRVRFRTNSSGTRERYR
ncbi:MAG: LysM peptidoglycan-binding domain-containing protein [Candidatus Melainabacteria bacterium]|nr:LysM peptidoglycan-binding domain-containing protein [Candidatus Melainabacteria bacterium]